MVDGAIASLRLSRGLPERARIHQRSTAGVGPTQRHPHRTHPAGKPQQNAYVERYNRTVSYAFLARTLLDTIEQVQDKATRWLWTTTMSARTWR